MADQQAFRRASLTGEPFKRWHYAVRRDALARAVLSLEPETVHLPVAKEVEHPRLARLRSSSGAESSFSNCAYVGGNTRRMRIGIADRRTMSSSLASSTPKFSAGRRSTGAAATTSTSR